MDSWDDLSVVRRLAVGGTAEALLAERSSGELVVLKRIVPDGQTQLAARLSREAELLVELKSPHIVRLIDHRPGSLLLEYVDGIDLERLGTHLAKRGSALSAGAALAAAQDLCGGLTALHRQGYVHADLSPANLLVARDGYLKITDLGVARVIGEVPPSEPEGTLAYQALEQLNLRGGRGRSTRLGTDSKTFSPRSRFG